jgi:hypothetical protein
MMIMAFYAKVYEGIDLINTKMEDLDKLAEGGIFDRFLAKAVVLTF